MEANEIMLLRIEADDLLPPALACQITEASKRLEQALIDEQACILKAKEAEKKAQALQSDAETKQLEMMIAKDEVVEIHQKIQQLSNEAKKADVDHKEAVELLETVKKLVEEMATKKINIQAEKEKKEKEITPAIMRASMCKIGYERHTAMVQIESIAVKKIIAEAEENVLRSRIEVADAKLNILEHPNCSELIPHMTGLIEWEGEATNG